MSIRGGMTAGVIFLRSPQAATVGTNLGTGGITLKRNERRAAVLARTVVKASSIGLSHNRRRAQSGSATA